MFGHKKAVIAENNQQKDTALLMECMQKLIEGDFSAIDTADFDNKELADKYNEMLEAVVDRNNRMTVRLNDAMVRIGDSELVKNMLEEVSSQTVSINGMRESSHELGSSIENIRVSACNIQDGSHGIIDASKECTDKMNESLEFVDDSSKQIADILNEMNVFMEKTKKINEIIDQVRNLAEDSSLLGLNASIEAARVGEAGRGFSVVADQMNQLSRNTSECAEDVVKYVGELIEGMDALAVSVKSATDKLERGNRSMHDSIDVIKAMNNKLASINSDIDTINDEIHNQSEVTDVFLEDIGNIACSYETLSNECQAIGARFYRISRDIDGARGDMFRKNSRPTLLDTLDVYEIDHLIFTWRIYNHIAGFEQLKIHQLNNPKGCKIGKWFGQQTDKVIVDNDGFRKAFDFHERLHGFAVESFEACERGDRERAMEHFYEALEAFGEFKDGMHMLKAHLKKNGITDATPIWIYEPIV